MPGSVFSSEKYREKLDSISDDVLKNVGISKGFIIWMGILFATYSLFSESGFLFNGFS